MAIVRSASNRLKLQLKSRFPVDRVQKSIFCIPYAIDEPNITPSEGKLSLFPGNKPADVTSIRINSITLLGADLTTFFEFSTEGGIVISDRGNADNFAAFKIGAIFSIDNGKAIQYDISNVLSSDAISTYTFNQQVCIMPLPAPTSEALAVINGGYY